MAGGEDLVELKFRLADGTDIGPSKYSLATTVVTLKEKIIADWPKAPDKLLWLLPEKEGGPKTIADVKLINAGKILENNRTLAEATLPLGQLPGVVVTMLVVLRAPMPDEKSEKLRNDSSRQPVCACTIL